MKFRSILLVAILSFSVSVYSQKDVDAVKAVVTSAYIEGIHNGGPIDNIRAGFHPSFNMLRLTDNEIRPLPIEDWIASIEKNRKESPGASVRTEGKFVNVSVAGNAANVVLELFRGDNRIFTDNLLLYKFEEGWRIVTKTYHRH